MARQELFLVFGGTLVDPRENVLADVAETELVGVFPSYGQAYEAWRGKSQQNVDDAYVRFFIAPLHEWLHPEAGPGA